MADGERPLILSMTQEAGESLASRSRMTAPRRDLTLLGSEPNSVDVSGGRRSLWGSPEASRELWLHTDRGAS